eukprot:TRINITY_DN13793_c0_g1_i1.p1 TRINITY_DN13793_c0_g1~~TRINITY_DN13793_c0_g1_i1.p1  ORF type:complete len:193 (+),score=42.99 TRINITY_DN13793_c0_g1_i1:78-581(+)
MVQFLKEYPERTELIFVDDNSDNAWNLYFHFAQAEKKGIGKYSMTSFWYPAPMTGRDEKHNVSTRKLIRRLHDSYGDSETSLHLLGEEGTPLVTTTTTTSTSTTTLSTSPATSETHTASSTSPLPTTVTNTASPSPATTTVTSSASPVTTSTDQSSTQPTDNSPSST